MKTKRILYSLTCAIFASLCIETSAIANQSTNVPLASSQVAVNRQSQDNSSNIILFLGLISVGAVSWHLWQSRKGNRPTTFAPIKNESHSNTALLDRVSPKLRRQLLRLINDPKTANRLLMGIYKDNSHRSPNWIAEKVIYDLRRGR